MTGRFGLVLYRLGQMAALGLLLVALVAFDRPELSPGNGGSVVVGVFFLFCALAAYLLGGALRFIFSG